MKKYVKPEIDVVTISSSTPIAFKSCTGENKDDYDFIERWVTDENGQDYVHYEWLNGSC